MSKLYLGENGVPSKKLFFASAVLFVLVGLPLISSVGASSEMWCKTYGGTGVDSAYSLVETSNGGYALAGYTRSFSVRLDDFWLVKTDQYGNVEWNQTYGGAPSTMSTTYSLVETSDGGYAMAGSIATPYGVAYYVDYLYDFWLIKTDQYGNVEWNQTYNRAERDVARSLVETSDVGYAIAGGRLIVKTDAYGNMEWNQTSPRSIRSLVETSDRGYAIAGTTNDDFWLAKTDEHGVIPEFPSWTIMPLLLVVTLVAVLSKQRLPKKPCN
ncbi:hypothetical protein D4R42_03835 [bacterium]|nr:MAG: hypothetical protein D4R42_03835 [bacterium]